MKKVVKMKWDRKKAIELLEFTKEYLNTFSDDKLYEMGKKLGYWNLELTSEKKDEM